MKRDSLVFVAAVASAMSAACCGVAQAGTESWMVSLSSSLSDFSGQSTFTYAIPLFDQQGGTRVLTGVAITGSAMFATSTQAFNGDFLPYAVNVSYSAGFTATLPSGVITSFQSGVASDPALMPATFGTFNFNLDAPVQASIGNIAQFSAPNGGTSVQTGTFTSGLVLPPLPSLTWSTPSQLMGAALTITYTFSVIPTPSSAAMLLAGGVIAMRRRR